MERKDYLVAVSVDGTFGCERVYKVKHCTKKELDELLIAQYEYISDLQREKRELFDRVKVLENKLVYLENEIKNLKGE